MGKYEDMRYESFNTKPFSFIYTIRIKVILMKEKFLKRFFRILRRCLSSEFAYRMFCGYCEPNKITNKNGNSSCDERCWKYLKKTRKRRKIESRPDYSCEL